MDAEMESRTGRAKKDGTNGSLLVPGGQ